MILVTSSNLANLRSYDDLLLDLYRALEGNGGDHLAARLRERYQIAEAA